ncbi:MAG TPA: SIS domain-containing protein [Candidatus Krumholzibacteria bacterium]|nr:SIS domain-containing protein [Candidatus Krumholzibacteria bacterium]
MSRPYGTMGEDELRARFHHRAVLFERSGELAEPIARAADVLVRSLEGGGSVFACGNGGSATQAAHFVLELVGRFKRERRALRAFSLAESAGTLTAIGNDYEFADVFARQLHGMLRPGDCLVALSTSGESENVVRACRAAREAKGRVLGLTGATGGRVASECDVVVLVPENDTPLVQEVHLAVLHLWCETVEEALFPRPTGGR